MTRLATLVNDTDPRLVASMFGLRPEGVADYLADHVDPTRLDHDLASPRATP